MDRKTSCTSDSRLLFVGGAPKAGTTSLHIWLGEHPEISLSKVKETRFFLDDVNPLPRATKGNVNIEEYFTFFHESDVEAGRILLDTTPDYLYSEKPLNISKKYRNSKFIFILRDPVSRFESHYKYAKQRGIIGENVTLTNFFEMQNRELDPASLPHLNALSFGNYDSFIEKYKLQYKDNMKILQFEELVVDPRAILIDVCVFLGISEKFYENFDFDVHNKTEILEDGFCLRMYYLVRRWLAFRIIKSDVLFNVFRTINRPLKRFISWQRARRSVNTSKNHRSVVDETDEVTLQKLSVYYSAAGR